MPDDLSLDIDVTETPPENAPRDALLGQTLGGFKLTRLLGTGGMGSVYLGEHQMIGSKVAVKVLHPELAANPQQVDRFHAEARAVNLIDHENIVRIFDLSVDPHGRHYFVMELLDGRPLSSVAKGPVPAAVAIPILTQVLSALSAAHARGVIHRDLKPDNIFLVKRGADDKFVKVLDFGVAKLLASGPVGGHTVAGMAIGTPTYMAPEQWTGAPVDGRADLYAVGMMSFLLATGRLPFPRGGLLEMLAYHREKIPDPPARVNPEVPEKWSEAILRALAKKPQERFQNAAEMAAAFSAALEKTPTAPALRTEAVPVIAPVSVAEISGRTTPVPSARYTPAPPISARVTPTPGFNALQTPAPSGEQRYTTRFAVRIPARVQDAEGKDLFDALCTELSRGGLYVCHSGTPPPIFTRLQIVLLMNGKVLDCPSEVVRHVSEADGLKWQMAAGFAVQFINPSQDLKESITEVLKAVASQHPGTAEAVRLSRIPASDFYAVLGMEPDATPEAIRSKAASIIELLQSAEKDAPTDQARRLAGEARQKVEVAKVTLADPVRRADHDVARRNYLGVSRCLDAGLTWEQLGQIHERFVQSNTYDANASRLSAISAGVWEKRGDLEQARAQYEAALRRDPANPALHKALRALTGGADKKIA